MKHREKILKKIDLLKSELREIARLISFDNEHYEIIAGFTSDSIMTGLIDKTGKFFPSQPTSYKSKEFQELELEFKIRLLCKGIYQAIKNIPVTELKPYLENDGPQIQLKILDNIFADKNIVEFPEIPESCNELIETMRLHIKNYRINVIKLEEEQWFELLEE
jgi:hypothetical protein